MSDEGNFTVGFLIGASMSLLLWISFFGWIKLINIILKVY